MDNIEKRLEVLLDLAKYEEVLSLAYENLQLQDVEQALLYEYIIVAHLNLENYLQSLEVCNEALGLYPELSPFLYYKSKAYTYMSAYKDATVALQEALTLEPNNAGYLAHYAKILLMRNKSIEAKEQIEKALKIDANKSEYHLLLAKVLYMLDGKRVAREIVDEVLAKEPHNAEALDMKQEYFTSKLKEKKFILKNLLFLNPFDEESQKDIKFIEFYYKYIPILMGVVILVSYLLQSNRHQFGFLEPFAFLGFAVVGTLGSKDWRFNVPFIATIVSFDAYFNVGSRGIDFGEAFYIIFQATLFQFVFMGAFKLFGGLKYRFKTRLQQQNNNKRNPVIFFLLIAPFERYEEIDTKAMKHYYKLVPLLMVISLLFIYIYNFHIQNIYFKIALILLFFYTAIESAKNLLFTVIFIFGVLLLINKFTCDGIFYCLFFALILSLIFPMLYNFARRFKK